MSKKWLLLIAVLVLLITGVDFYLQAGTIFLLDGIWYPISWSQYLTFLQESLWARSIYRWIHEGVGMLLGYQLFSKLYIVGTLFLSGVLGAKLGQEMARLMQRETKYHPFAIGAGILFLLFNPVLYERVITQPGIYLAMVCVGFGLLALIQSLRDTTWKPYLWSGISFAIAIMLSPHMIFMVGLLLAGFAIFFARSWQQWRGLIMIGMMSLLLNANWLIGGFMGKGAIVTDTIATFNQANIDGFVSNAQHPLNIELTNLLLYGFWGERYGHFAPIEDFNPYWHWYGVVLLLIWAFGAYYAYQKHAKFTLWLLLSAGIARIAACGISSSWFGGLNQWFFDTIPFYIGLREPQKWIVIVMLVWAIFWILATGSLFQKIDQLFEEFSFRVKFGAGVLVMMALVFGYVPMLLGAFWGQLTVSDYPEDFQRYQSELLDHDLKRGNILIVPWHSYIACPRTHYRVVSNPIKAYLGQDPRMITSDNIEIGSLYTNSTSTQSQNIETFLTTHDLKLLQQHQIQTILFAGQCADFLNYTFLEELPGLTKTFSGEFLSVYSLP